MAGTAGREMRDLPKTKQEGITPSGRAVGKGIGFSVASKVSQRCSIVTKRDIVTYFRYLF